MAQVKFEKLSSEDWDKIPQPKPKQNESPYDEAIQAVIDGETIVLPYADQKDLNGKRIGIARRAKGMTRTTDNPDGVKLEFKDDKEKQRLAIRLAREKPTAPEGEKRGPGRPKKA